MKNKLLPCPFCGVIPTITYYDAEKTYRIMCQSTSCPLDLVSTDSFRDKITAIELWNFRY